MDEVNRIYKILGTEANKVVRNFVYKKQTFKNKKKYLKQNNLTREMLDNLI